MCVCVSMCVFSNTTYSCFSLSLSSCKPSLHSPRLALSVSSVQCSSILHFIVTEENVSQSHRGIDLLVLFFMDIEG